MLWSLNDCQRALCRRFGVEAGVDLEPLDSSFYEDLADLAQEESEELEEEMERAERELRRTQREED